MSKKQPEPPVPNEEQILEERVDAMMDAKRPDPDASAGASATPADTSDAGLPPLDIFAGTPAGAPKVPDGLTEEAEDHKSEPETADEPQPATAGKPASDSPPAAPLDLDDAATDAAVDDIVKHEADAPAEKLDDAGPAEADFRPPPKIHHHPVFWGLVTVIAVLAILAAVLLAGGGNLNFPGGRQLQSWFNSLQR